MQKQSDLFEKQKPNMKHWVRSKLSTLKLICPSSGKLHPVSKVAQGTGEDAWGQVPKRPIILSGAWGNTMGPEGMEPTANSGPPPKQWRPHCLSPGLLIPVASPLWAPGSFLFKFCFALFLLFGWWSRTQGNLVKATPYELWAFFLGH
jgi:hypothetical protein